jgi:hypothetical protein
MLFKNTTGLDRKANRLAAQAKLPQISSFSLPSPTRAAKPATSAQAHWSRGPMDRTMASEAVGSGSIPLGTTSSYAR